MRKHIFSVLTYFGYFLYAPSFDEIHAFFPIKISKKNLQLLLAREVQRETIVQLSDNTLSRAPQGPFINCQPTSHHFLYTLPQYSTIKKIKLKNKTQNKIKKRISTIQRYIQMLETLPFVRFIGITGASAVEGLQQNDDLDLCIVTQHNLLWTTRFFAIVCAKLLRIHRRKEICLNLFFDESHLALPKKKNNSYIAHELLQMRSVVDKDNVYERFLEENRWIYTYFPNTKKVYAQVRAINQQLKDKIVFVVIDRIFKSIQLPIIRRNNTAFSITNTQLWLFKNDFEKKLKRAGLVI
ncbi:MAG: hypothetical protein V1922_05745 [bacterium]